MDVADELFAKWPLVAVAGVLEPFVIAPVLFEAPRVTLMTRVAWRVSGSRVAGRRRRGGDFDDRHGFVSQDNNFLSIVGG